MSLAYKFLDYYQKNQLDTNKQNNNSNSYFELERKLLADFRDQLPNRLRYLYQKNTPQRWCNKDDAGLYERIKGYGNERCYVIVDIDVEKKPRSAQQLYLPEKLFKGIMPNFVVFNPQNQNYQAFWRLEDPVYCQKLAQTRRPFRYLREIESAIDKKVGGDDRFGRCIHRNPLFYAAELVCYHDKKHSFTDFNKVKQLECEKKKNDVVDINDKRTSTTDIKKLSNESGQAIESRNCSVFDRLRFHLYKLVTDLKKLNPELTYDNWYSQAAVIAMSYNKFADKKAMTQAEVLCIARSVAHFCFYEYNHKNRKSLSDKAFKKRQSERGKRGSKEDKAKAGSLGGAKSKGGGRPSIGEPWKDLGISRRTYFRRKSNGDFS